MHVDARAAALKRRRIGFLVACVVLAVLAIAISMRPGAWRAQPTGKYGGIGGDFTLQSANGPLSLHDLKGRVVDLMSQATPPGDIAAGVRRSLQQ